MKERFKSKLKGNEVTLQKFQKKYIPEIVKCANDKKIWQFNKGDGQSIQEFLSNYIDNLNKEMIKGTQWPYVVIQNKTQKVIGSTRFYDISIPDKRVAIGFTWYHPSVWGTKVNPETKLLLLQFIFEELAFNRVEFHIDSRNKQSINAVKKLGARQEGILRKHKIVQNNFVRDTVLCSIIDSEWASIKKSLLSRIQ